MTQAGSPTQWFPIRAAPTLPLSLHSKCVARDYIKIKNDAIGRLSVCEFCLEHENVSLEVVKVVILSAVVADGINRHGDIWERPVGFPKDHIRSSQCK
jgi:hypothetical protein